LEMRDGTVNVVWRERTGVAVARWRVRVETGADMMRVFDLVDVIVFCTTLSDR
jgi:hypothetical protein